MNAKLVFIFIFCYYEFMVSKCYVSFYNSPLGEITLGSDGQALVGLWFNGEKYYCEGYSDRSEKYDLNVFEETKAWLDIYFSGKVPDFYPKLKLEGSAFRKEVWQILQKIRYGQTVTYGDIAEEIAKKHGMSKMSAQAVGGAVGHNPISIIVPCHRVVGKNYSLTGYAGGLDKKVALLKIEGINTTRFKDF